jgi:hypothetical protein
MTEEEAKQARADKREEMRRRAAEYYKDHREQISEQRRLLWAACPELRERKQERDRRYHHEKYIPKTRVKSAERPDKKPLTKVQRMTARIQKRNERIQRKADAFRAKLAEEAG